MTEFETILILILVAVAAPPLLPKTWRGYRYVALGVGVVVAYPWVVVVVEKHDALRLYAAFIALCVTSSWIVGLLGGAIRLLGRQHGWSIVRFPLIEIVVIAVAILLPWMLDSVV